MHRRIFLLVSCSFIYGCSGSDKLSKSYRKGLANFNDKDYESAIEQFTQVIEMDDKYAMAYMMRGNSHAALKKHEEAIKDFTKVIELDSQNKNAYLNRSLSYKATGKANLSKTDADKAKKFND